MANESTSSTLSELYTEIVAEAQFVAQEQSIMRNLVRNYAISGGGKAVEVPIYAAVSAAAVSEASDLSNTAIDPSSVTITASEVGVMTTLTDLARNSAPRNVAADIGRLFGEAIAKKQDTDMTALFDGFSTAVGDGTAAISAAGIFNAASDLRAAALNINECAVVLHPKIAYDLKANLTNTFANSNANDLANEALRSGFVGTLAGMRVFETSNMSNTGNAGDYKGAAFHRDALAMAEMQGLKVETQRDASLRADEIVATAVYGVGEIHDSYGVELHFDSSIQ
ncbi:phage major capsid protein, HK97 family (TIGR01554) [uncultured Mediterranean phage uvMED]|jgi:HK97 family phage major capsid protein|nr:MAG: phage major capsid protein [Verrucomicrobia bacterium TMED175]BAQ91377.1 phage major capsid protein, HK97 family (TIGR01554) [uncultured Mediterranean phage uvMED]BAQ91433.1 phage major capsid protein, HK97 family (TIGR01554) [uncultured Mediterranean phage uvMED]BAQ91445.1 phage major capsid protein, HK97 family (TIGR01554) [uncultured Mediterranean phage uvMED]BAQ91533.1 phage major capsid protein, HK97 family (TIGR01554) [uncultured Mediterranean phage uvMED]|tara:strand:+ start:1819 stop:2664 length:846 start_codon:yes stop_codon:yes gene_type:complete